MPLTPLKNTSFNCLASNAHLLFHLLANLRLCLLARKPTERGSVWTDPTRAGTLKFTRSPSLKGCEVPILTGLTQSQHIPARAPLPTAEGPESGPIILVYCSLLKKAVVEMLILSAAPLAKSRGAHPRAEKD